MTTQSLKGRKVAILATDGFEQSELEKPKKALEDAGAETKVVAPKDGKIKGWRDKDWGDKVSVDLALDEADASAFDALLMPGGVMNPDSLRLNDRAVEFIKHFTESGKPIAAICHGPWPLIETGFVKGKTMTSWPSLKTDLTNAGAKWVDAEVVVDHGLVTSRKPDDIPAFNRKMIQEFAQAAQGAVAPETFVGGFKYW
ncbi:MAG TPA: type 1 glutamine amidotransferase domain-containing protein [Bdellovibrionales bacterium]|nr:type 1 glutamine amidotransferase domain-containing protein [Bdellovibrionales bacterium]